MAYSDRVRFVPNRDSAVRRARALHLTGASSGDSTAALADDNALDLRMAIPSLSDGVVMTTLVRALLGAMIIGLPLAVPAGAQPQPARLGIERAPGTSRNTANPAAVPVKEKLNAWTVGLAGGLLEGAPAGIGRILEYGPGVRARDNAAG